MGYGITIFQTQEKKTTGYNEIVKELEGRKENIYNIWGVHQHSFLNCNLFQVTNKISFPKFGKSVGAGADRNSFWKSGKFANKIAVLLNFQKYK